MELSERKLQEYSQIFIDGCLESMKNEIRKDKRSANVKSELIVDKMIDEVILDLVSEYHRASRLGENNLGLSLGENNLGLTKTETAPKEQLLLHSRKFKPFECPICKKLQLPGGFGRHLERICLKEYVTDEHNMRNTRSRKATGSKEPTYNPDDDDDETFEILKPISSSKSVKQKKKKKYLR